MAGFAAGLLGLFQGLPLRSVTIRRTRSWGGDRSELEAVVPAGFDVVVPQPRDLARAIDRPAPTDPIEATGSNRLEALGYVHLSASIDGLPLQATQPHPGPWALVAGPCFVIRAEEVKRATSAAGPRTVKIVVVDERYFWARGVLERWSYNRKMASGVVALDSVRPDGKLFTRREVADAVVASLPRRPRLVAAPASWDADRAPLELARWGQAVEALAQLAAPAGLEDPCLRWDATVALHAAGDGLLGYAPDGKGPNSAPIPEGLILWKEGTGEGRVSEPAWPEDYVLVVGGERVASVAVDAWEPVLQLPPDGRYVPLDDETVVALTGRPEFNLEWLKRFVLRPAAYQSNPFLDPDVAALLAEQSWRLYRLRKAVVRRTSGLQLAEVKRDEPGPNAHLLPLLDRAETDGSGRRLAPQVETYHFVPVHHELQSNAELDELAEVRRQIARIRATITSGVLTGRDDRFSIKGKAFFNLLSADDTIDGFDSIFKDSGVAPVSFAEFQGFVQRAREAEQYRGTPQGDRIAEELKRLGKQELELLEKAGGLAGQDELLEAAYALLDTEEDLRDLVGVSTNPNALREALERPENAAIRESLRLKLQDLMEKIAAERVEAQDRAATTAPEGTAIVEAKGLLRYVNRKRSIDTEARVESEQAGVIRTSRLAGHVTPDQVGDLSRASFVPAPVRVTFGAVLRPRVDVVSGRAATPAPSSSPDDSTDDFGGVLGPAPAEDVVPEVLSDRETYYVAAFERRGQRRAVPIRVADAQLDRAVRLEEPNLVELVNLDGASNRNGLDDAAQRRAADAFDAPEVVRSRRICVAHLWPVNCDGIVSSVEIRTKFKGGVPVGFETVIETGAAPNESVGPGRTIARPPRPGNGRAAEREGLVG